MASLLRLTLVAVWLAAVPAVALAIDQVPWAPTVAEAQKAATEQGKLVLIHFYNDHCPPCERFEREVFSQPAVGQAVARNYIPVKVHAGAQPKVAEHFRVDRWPTDIICTPAGLEIMRTTSPQRPEAYLNLIGQVAMQTGVGASRQWQSSMEAVGQQVLDPHVAQAQAVAGDGAQAAQGYANQAAGAAQSMGNRATATFEAYAAQANRWNQQATATAQQTAQEAGNAAQHLGNAAQQLGNSAQQLGNSAYAQFAQPQAGAAPAPGIGAPPTTNAPPSSQISVSPAVPSLPTTNPFITQQPAAAPAAPPAVESSPSSAAAATPPASGPSPQPTTESPAAAPPAGHSPPTKQTGTASPMASAPFAGSPNKGLTPASEAPPIAMEGYCPVTLFEQNKWQRANPQYGVIHDGRTYLFVSEIEKNKFLADPYRFSPVLAGRDPVAFSERGELIEGKRCYGARYKNQIFLFSDKMALERFHHTPQPFADQARQAMQGGAGGLQLR